MGVAYSVYESRCLDVAVQRRDIGFGYPLNQIHTLNQQRQNLVYR
ncbi:MAG: hypothetical protein AAF915_20900 [Cyanobacteria bacterium P01_D01_bin.50]